MPLCLCASPFITNTIAWPARRTAGSGLLQRGCILGNRTSTPTRSQGPSPPSRSSARTLTGHMFSHTLLRSCITRWADTFTPVILLWCCDRGIRCRDTRSGLPEKNNYWYTQQYAMCKQQPTHCPRNCRYAGPTRACCSASFYLYCSWLTHGVRYC